MFLAVARPRAPRCRSNAAAGPGELARPHPPRRWPARRREPRFPCLCMGHGSGRTLMHPGRGPYCGLDFGKTQPHPANFHEVTAPPFNPQESVFIHGRQVAGLEPSVPEPARSLLRVVEIALTNRRPFDPDLAALPGRNLSFPVIQDANRQVVQRHAGAAQLFSSDDREAGN